MLAFKGQVKQSYFWISCNDGITYFAVAQMNFSKLFKGSHLSEYNNRINRNLFKSINFCDQNIPLRCRNIFQVNPAGHTLPLTVLLYRCQYHADTCCAKYYPQKLSACLLMFKSKIFNDLFSRKNKNIFFEEWKTGWCQVLFGTHKLAKQCPEIPWKHTLGTIL